MHKQSGRKGPVKQPGRTASPHRIRIIGGEWKRTPLVVLDAQGLRPTPDRVRETVFNWLSHLLGGQWQNMACLDLFAGTGALGFEAASRGAGQVTMVESNPMAIKQLEATKEKLHANQVNILRGDALWIARRLVENAGPGTGLFDLIFLDPPYHQDWLQKIFPICARLLKEGGLVYAESEQKLDNEALPDWLSGWNVVRQDQAGMVFYNLLRRNNVGQN